MLCCPSYDMHRYDRSRTPIESAYFHVSNGGLTFTVYEIGTEYGNIYECETKLSTMGVESVSTWAIPGPDAIAWIARAMSRVQGHMEASPLAGVRAEAPTHVIEDGQSVPQPREVCESSSDGPTYCRTVWR